MKRKITQRDRDILREVATFPDGAPALNIVMPGALLAGLSTMGFLERTAADHLGGYRYSLTARGLAEISA